ncbi:MAG: LacI family DNA-binding transcriptional regulator [Lachnospiraceae bacterium]|nr:LacI family DNA-binding transcriptional regulator [Lachnospiraceae bacterium]
MTIKDIAELSGYGIGTVSRVINKQSGVSNKAREKILKIIEESNYEPNENARQLKKRAGDVIAIIMKGRRNGLFIDILERLTYMLSSMQEGSIVQIIDEDEDEVAEALRFIRDKNLKGLIFLGANLALFDDRMKEIDIPCIITTTSATDLPWKNVSSVSVDDESAASELVRYLASRGHKNIVVIGGSISEKQISYARYMGCKKGFQENGLEFDSERNYVACRYSMEAGYEVTKKILASSSDVTAIVALSDTIAVGAMRAIKDAGKQVPDDISVVGFDGIELSKFCIPRITTISQDTDNIAKRSVELLFKHMQNTLGNEHDIAPYRLVEGESVREWIRN